MTTETINQSQTSGDFRVLSVFGDLLSVLSRRFASFYTATLIVNLPTIWFLYDIKYHGESANRIILIIIASFILGSLYQPALIHITIQQIQHKNVTTAQSIAIGFSRIFHVLSIVFLSLIPEIVGYALFLVPGIILSIMWYVTLPVCVMERAGILESFRKSVQMTRGYRWKIFFIVVIFLATTKLAEGFINVYISGINSKAITIAISYLWSSLTLCFSSILPSIVYFHLKYIKDGIGIDHSIENSK